MTPSTQSVLIETTANPRMSVVTVPGLTKWAGPVIDHMRRWWRPNEAVCGGARVCRVIISTNAPGSGVGCSKGRAGRASARGLSHFKHLASQHARAPVLHCVAPRCSWRVLGADNLAWRVQLWPFVFSAAALNSYHKYAFVGTMLVPYDAIFIPSGFNKAALL